MVVDTKGIDWYNVVDGGFKLFLSVLLALVLIGCVYLIVHYCKIIHANYVEYKTKQAELKDIKLQVNRVMSQMYGTKE